MTISELCKKYNLHDSLIEGISYDRVKNVIIIDVDFCYWQQEQYINDMKETGKIKLIFSGVLNFNYTQYPINSDEIISINNTSDNELFLEVYSDVTEECHCLNISAKQVEIINNEDALR